MPNRRSVLKSLALASAASLARRGAAGMLATGPALKDSGLQDPLRPSYHYLPARNWMNDPCGPLYFKGQYHLFHQYNPHGPLWGDMHWAHAVSPDMVHWKRLPVALAPTPGGADAQGCFTGTAVVRDGRPTLLYTGVKSAAADDATLVDDHSALRESQCLAVATDDTLGSWKKLASPVIPTPPPGMKVTGFRDPSPWREGEVWYTVVGSGVAGKGGMALLYRSADLRTWEYLHPLIEGEWSGKAGGNPVDTGEMWECPDFFALTDTASHALKHVLIYSTQGKVLWRSGTWDKTTLRFEAEKAGELDYGRVGTNRVTYYAPKTQLDAEGNRILWGWISETRPDAECGRAGWSGLMSLPRVLTLGDGELRMAPSPRVASLRRAEAAGGRVQEFHATLEAASGEGKAFRLRDGTGALLDLGADAAQDPKTLRFAFGNGVAPIEVPLAAPFGREVEVAAFFDNSVLEIFVDHRYCLTHRFYDRAAVTTGSEAVETPIASVTFAGNLRVKASRAYSLRSIWEG